MTLKVLKLENWMLFKYGETPEEYIKYGTIKEIDPLLNRPGYYRKDGTTWFENKGRAYEILNDKMFDYTLSLIPYKVLRECEAKAIRFLLINKLPIHKKLFEDYRVYLDVFHLKQMKIDMRKRLLHFNKTKGKK